jgi:hypothetical protein
MTELEQLKNLQEDFKSLYNSLHKVYASYLSCQERDLAVILTDQAEFSLQTFGPGNNTTGIIDHIRSELEEVESDPSDIFEWIDVAILAFDGAWRNGYTPTEIVNAYRQKLAINKNRQWPDWRTAEAGKAIEHIDKNKG